MVVSPHPIEVTVYDSDNTTLKQGARVYLRNVTKRTTSDAATTDANGEAVIDLANLPLASGQTNEYDEGDIVFIIAAYGENHDAARYAVTGASKEQTLYLNPLRHLTDITKEVLQTLIVANTDGSNPYYAKLYNVNDGSTITHVECLANSTVVVPANFKCSGGILCVRENKAIIVTAAIK